MQEANDAVSLAFVDQDAREAVTGDLSDWSSSSSSGLI